MPTITIDRSTSRLPSSTGINPSDTIKLDQTSILGEVGKVIGEFQAQAQEAEDATYVANSGIEAQRRSMAIRDELQKKYTQNPKGYSEELYARLTEEVYKPLAENAPSSSARAAVESNFTGYARADIAKDTEWEKQATMSNYLGQHNQNVNLLSSQLAERPSEYKSIMAQYEVLSDVSSTYLTPKAYNDAKARDKKILGEALFAGTLESSPEKAKQLLNSEEFRGVFSAENIRQMEVKAKKRQAVFKNEGEQQVLASSLKALELASSGSISFSAIENDPSLTEQDKGLAKAILTGDETAIDALAKVASVSKGDLDGINSYAIAADLREITASFNNKGEERGLLNPANLFAENDKFKTNEDISQTLESLNVLKNKATIARAFNTNNRGKGITKAEYEAVLKDINAASTKILTYADDNNPTFGNDTVYDYIFDEVNNLSEDPQVKSELLGYASAVAKANGVDVFSEVPSSQAKKTLEPIMEELKSKRRKSLGLPLSAPNTGSAIVNGKKEKLGQGDPSVQADRSVVPPFKIMEDKNGNRARVYPDGRIEEIK